MSHMPHNRLGARRRVFATPARAIVGAGIRHIFIIIIFVFDKIISFLRFEIYLIASSVYTEKTSSNKLCKMGVLCSNLDRHEK